MPWTTTSVNGKIIRLTDERWAHIIFGHAELHEALQLVLSTVAEPLPVAEWDEDEYSAIQQIAPGKWLIVVYRETSEEGFIITAFTTRNAYYYLDRTQVWP